MLLKHQTNMQLAEAEVDCLTNSAVPLNSSHNIRWERDEYAEKVAAMDVLKDRDLSDRAIAKELDVPRSTLQA